jgi:hypothetical protein
LVERKLVFIIMSYDDHELKDIFKWLFQNRAANFIDLGSKIMGPNQKSCTFFEACLKVVTCVVYSFLLTLTSLQFLTAVIVRLLMIYEFMLRVHERTLQT